MTTGDGPPAPCTDCKLRMICKTYDLACTAFTAFAAGQVWNAGDRRQPTRRQFNALFGAPGEVRRDQ